VPLHGLIDRVQAKGAAGAHADARGEGGGNRASWWRLSLRDCLFGVGLLLCYSQSGHMLPSFLNHSACVELGGFVAAEIKLRPATPVYSYPCCLYVKSAEMPLLSLQHPNACNTQMPTTDSRSLLIHHYPNLLQSLGQLCEGQAIDMGVELDLDADSVLSQPDGLDSSVSESAAKMQDGFGEGLCMGRVRISVQTISRMQA